MAIADIGFPLVIRPSYVLGGRAMEIVRDTAQLDRYIREAVVVSGDSPVLLDSYLSGAVEVDVDALCDGEDVHVAGIMQHIERPACIPATAPARCRPTPVPRHPSPRSSARPRRWPRAQGQGPDERAIRGQGSGDEIYLIEVNPRASRTVPFVAKATDSAIASIAARLMAGEPLSNFPRAALRPRRRPPTTVIPWPTRSRSADPNVPWFSVKEAVLPFARFPGVDTILGPEMRSTGEVMGWDRSFPRASSRRRWARAPPARDRHGVHLDQGRRQDPRLLEPPRCWSSSGLLHPRHPRHRGLPRGNGSRPRWSTRSTKAAAPSSTG
jgi:carbamoyl-phosphate synthase large subunit